MRTSFHGSAAMGRQGKVGGFGPAVWVWWLVGSPVDFRCGADRLLVHVREVLEHGPLDGSTFVFRNRRGTRLKMLVVDVQGVSLAQRRLRRGRFVLPSSHVKRLLLDDRHLLPLASPHLQLCFLTQPLHVLVVHGFTRLPQFQMDHPYAIALVSWRQCHDALPKIHVALWHHS